MEPALSQSLRSAAADHDADPRRGLRRVVGELAKAQGHWAGCPMPLDGEALVIADAFPEYAPLARVGKASEEETPPGYRFRNAFRTTRWQGRVVVYEKPNGRVGKYLEPHGHGNKADKILRTLGCSDAWGIEQEERAMATLRSLITPRQYRHYVLTGSLLETSKRSGLVYLFRRLRPTIALAVDHEKDATSILACLCMHPIAHYADSWAGAMCPTDDVIAHLMLMRGDEALYWKRCNQHAPGLPEAGL
jgi:hypothetical protein